MSDTVDAHIFYPNEVQENFVYRRVTPIVIGYN